MEMFGFERRINNIQQYQYYYHHHHHHRNRNCNINDDDKNNSKNNNNNNDDGDLINKQINYKKFHNDLLLSVTDAIKPATNIATIAAISTPINTILTNGTTNNYSTATVTVEKLKNYKNSLLSSSSSLPLPLSSKKLFLNDDHNDSKLNSIKKFDKTLLRTVLIGTVIIIIIYKIIQFSWPFTTDRTENMELFETFRIIYSKVSNQMENFLSSSMSSSSSSSTTTITNFMYSGLITSLLCGFAFTIYTGLIVYMDSYVPGINPPIPFISKSGYSKNKWNPPYIGYLTAIAGGIVVSCLMYFDF